MAKVLALDFDGVIFDSIREAFTVALHTVTGRDPTSRLAEHPLIAGRCSPDLFPFAEDPTFRAFLDIVPLGNRAEDYSVILSAIQDGTPVPDQTAYDRLYRGLDEILRGGLPRGPPVLSFPSPTWPPAYFLN